MSEPRKLSRRDVVKGAVLGSAAAVGAGALLRGHDALAASVKAPLPQQEAPNSAIATTSSAIAPNTFYRTVVGSNFKPVDSSSAYIYSGLDSLQASGASAGQFSAALTMPTGAVVTSAEYYLIYNDANGATGFLLGTSPTTATFSALFSASNPPASAAIQTMPISVTPFVVDNNGSSYTFRFAFNTAGPTQKLYGARVGYTMGRLYQARVTTQQNLINSDGATWTDMDAGGGQLSLAITPNFNCLALLTGSADLWTWNAGFNQDMGIGVTGGAYPTVAGQPEAWKESGGFAGTFSPNAAFVQVAIPLAAGTAYTIKLRWKANKPGVSQITAGAGPIGGQYSPTSLTAVLTPTN